MKKYNSIDELGKDREILEEKFENGLPNYLIEFFDKEEKQLVIKDTVDDMRESGKSTKEIASYRYSLRTLPEKIEDPSLNPAIKNIDDEEETLNAQEVKVLKEVCKYDMYAFAVRYFGHYLKKRSSKLHKYLYKTINRKITDVRKDRTFKIAIAAPRTNAKSSLISLILPIWCICYRKKKFIVMLSDTGGKAEGFLEDIKRELMHNEKLIRDFPEATGKGSMWRVDEIITKNDVKIMSKGTGSNIRGERYGVDRPDLVVCHEKGTKIFYNNEWINIEDYPNSKNIIANGYKIKINGHPCPETVTEDHKYFIKKIERRKDINYDIGNNWIKAQEIKCKYWKHKYYIGYPIDNTIEKLQPILVLDKPYINKRCPITGKIISVAPKAIYKYIIPEEFYDIDFWWFVGLWWGDGYSSGKYRMNITIANKDTHTFEKLKKILNKYNKSFTISECSGCFQVIFSWAIFARWLKTWRIGNSRKCPPYWVERIDPKYQKELIKGYVDADGFIDYKGKSIRITSIHLEGLLSVKRMLLRLGIPSSIRSGIDGKDNIKIVDHYCKTNKKYDIRFRQNVYKLGYNIENQDRYKIQRMFIKDNYLWSKIETVEKVYNKEFIPIKTKSGTYVTNFGLSHNCDDIENSEMVRSKVKREHIRYDWFNKDVLYAGGEAGTHTDFFMIGTILGKDSLLNSILDPEQYPTWETRRFAAVMQFPESDKWEEWEKLLKNRLDSKRVETAEKFFEDNVEEMNDGAEVLWPEGDPLYGLMVERASDPSGFLSEKQNESIDPSKVLVLEEDLTFIDFNTLEIRNLLKSNKVDFFAALDPSLGKGKDSDFSCIVTIARDRKTGYLYVVEIDLKRRSVDDQIEGLISKYEKYGYKNIAIETNAFQIVLADNLRKESRKLGLYMPITDIQNYSDKHMRIQSLVPLLKDGTLIFDKTRFKRDQSYNNGINMLLEYSEGVAHDDACVTPETNIITFNGVKAISEVSTDDLVLTHTGEYKRVNKVYKRRYDGDIINLEASGTQPVNISCNHPIYVNTYKKYNNRTDVYDDHKFVNAEDVYSTINTVNSPIIKYCDEKTIDMSQFLKNYIEKDGLVYGTTYNGSRINPKSNPIPRYIKIDEEFAFMIGYYLAEGSCNKTHSISYAHNTKEKNVIEFLITLYKKYGIHKNYNYDRENSLSSKFFVNSVPFRNMFSQFLSSVNKKLPSIFMELPEKETRSLILGYFFGDGCFTEGYAKSNSISKSISYQIWLLLAKIGIRSNINFVNRKNRYKGFGKNGLINNDTYNITMSRTETVKLLNNLPEFIKNIYKDKNVKTIRLEKNIRNSSYFTNTTLSRKIRKCDKKQYKGYLYNLGVDEDNSYVANGLIVHNCDALEQCVRICRAKKFTMVTRPNR